MTNQDQLLEAACAGITALAVSNPVITPTKLEFIIEAIKNPLLTDNLIERVREYVANFEKKAEPPMPFDEAARLLGFSKTSLQNAIRAGRIRRVRIPGSSRGRGVVAADVRAILNGEEAA